MEECNKHALGAAPHRLFLPRIQDKFHVSYSQVAGFIDEDNSHDYFLDTNFFTDHEVQQCVWDALGRKRITMTKGVWKELTPWRRNPFYNRHMVSVFDAAKT